MASLNIFDQLTVLAQIGATLLGFVAVFLVIVNRSRKFGEADRHFLQALVLSGFFVIVMSLVPGALSYHMPVERVWEVSLAIGVIVGAAIAAFQLKIQLSMSKEEAARIHIAWHLIAWGMGTVILLFALAGLFDIANDEAMLLASLSLALVLCLWSFVSLVFRKFF